MVSEQYKKDPSFDLRGSFSVNLKVFVTVKARQLGKICKCVCYCVIVLEGGVAGDGGGGGDD